VYGEIIVGLEVAELARYLRQIPRSNKRLHNTRLVTVLVHTLILLLL